jgi:hypothetical protein
MSLHDRFRFLDPLATLHPFRRGRSVLLVAPALVLGALAVHCGGKGDDGSPGPSDTDVDDSAVGETIASDASDATTDGSDVKSDTPPIEGGTDTAPPPVTCTKAPTYGAPLKLNHNPDSLRQVSNGSMALLPDGRLMVVFLEDSGSRYGLYARVVDTSVAGGKAGVDERLDVDADNLASSSGLTLSAIPGGALVLQYSPSSTERRVRIYAHGKWSPEITSAMPVSSSDGLTFTGASNGTVLVSRARASTPSGAAVVYKPDEGGAFGSWSPVQTLDLDGGSGTPTIQPWALPDGRFLVAVWHGAGGPSMRLRSVTGAWTAPGLKAEIGATDARPSFQLLDDGSLVLAALEGSGDVRRVVTSTWTSSAGWTTARLLSKTIDANGVIPFNSDPFLFPVSGSEIEFVGWVAGCTGPAKDCQFHPVSRRYVGGVWKDPTDLAVGDTRTGADGLAVVSVGGGAVVIRTAPDGTQIQIRARFGTDWAKLTSILDGSPLFGSSTRAAALFFAGGSGFWALADRHTIDDAGPSLSLANAIGKLDPAGIAGSSWGAVIDGAGAEMRDLSRVNAYADGAGGFTVATNAWVSSSSSVPVLGHASASGGALEVQRVVLSDEKDASFSNFPRFPPRPGADKSAIYTVTANLSATGPANHKLRAYAWNGVGSVVPQLLAREERVAHTFTEGLLTFGCGGAILYAVDPVTDGSHGLEIVLVQ